MELVHALRHVDPASVAFVGAGGKTTALFRLARQISSPVIVTTTTHFAKWQLSLADHHFLITSTSEINRLGSALPSGVIIITGPETEPERMSGLDHLALDKISTFAQSARISVLIEADGSRQRPVKAPASHEPVIPDFVDTVVEVAGLSALNKPLTADWIHRPEQFAKLSGLSIGDMISIDALARVLVHHEGGLKCVPANARRIALLNQADTPYLQAQGQALGNQLLPSYQAVVVASLQYADRIRKEQHIPTAEIGIEKDAGRQEIFSVIEQVAGIVLAGGGSSRLGKPKQLLFWRDRTFVEHVASVAIEAGLWPVVVVTGAHGNEVRRVIQHLPVNIVHNSQWEIGQSTSIRTGLEALAEGIGAVVFLLVDQPQIPAQLIRKLIETHAKKLSLIVSPQIDGRRGNPVLFDKSTFPDLMKLEGDIGGRALFSRHKPHWVLWFDPRLLQDVDTMDDYERLIGYED